MSEQIVPSDFGADDVRALPFQRHTEVILKHLPLEGMRVLDVGCGDGGLVRWMVRRGALAEGLEPAEHQLARAREATPMGSETYSQGGAEDMAFASDVFDSCVFFNSLHHVPMPQQARALAEAARVTRPGGHLYVAEPVASGSLFLAMQPVDDETEVRASAEMALQSLSPDLAERTVREHYHTRRHYAAYEDFVEDLCQVSPDRRQIFDEKQDEVTRLYDTLGESTSEGMRFYQPMRVTVFVVK